MALRNVIKVFPVSKNTVFSRLSLPKNCSTTSSVDTIDRKTDYIGRPDKLYSQIDIELRAHQSDVLKSYSWFATTAAKELNVRVLESWAEPEPHKVRKTLLRSAFASSKHRVQYEFR